MSGGHPRIVGRKSTPISPWVTLVEKSVQFTPGSEPDVYHCLTQRDYIGVLAVTSDGLIPLVRQYRPSVEDFTWEFPAGTLDEGETAEEAARRELTEETGLQATRLVSLGCFVPDTGRLQIKSHAFFAETPPLSAHPTSESGLEVRFVTLPELHEMMRTMEFRHQLHWAVYAAAVLGGAIKLSE